MRHLTRTLRTGLVLGLLAIAALALAAKGGYVATPVFSLSDAPSSIVYDEGFGGVEWADMDTFALGPLARTTSMGEEAALAVGAGGEIYALVYGYVGTDDYTGVTAFDGGEFTHVTQDEQLDAGVPWHYRAGGTMRAIAVAPVSAGQLTAGHLLVVRTWREEAKYDPNGVSGDNWLELLDIDPDTGSRTLVHRWLCTVNANARVAADSEGGVLVGPDGSVYTFEDHHGLGWNYTDGTKPVILKVDPDTGTTSNWAEVDGRSHISDWAFDSAGNLRILLDGGSRKRAITTATAGGTATAGRGSIASWTGDFVNLAPAGEGGLYVAEAVYGGGGKGGGGGGKGKNR